MPRMTEKFAYADVRTYVYIHITCLYMCVNHRYCADLRCSHERDSRAKKTPRRHAPWPILLQTFLEYENRSAYLEYRFTHLRLGVRRASPFFSYFIRREMRTRMITRDPPSHQDCKCVYSTSIERAYIYFRMVLFSYFADTLKQLAKTRSFSICIRA